MPLPGARGALHFDLQVDDAPSGRAASFRVAEGSAPKLHVYARSPVSGKHELVQADGWRFIGSSPLGVVVDEDGLRIYADHAGTYSIGVNAAGTTDDVTLEVVPVSRWVVGLPLIVGSLRGPVPIAVVLANERARFPLLAFGSGGAEVVAVGIPARLSFDPAEAASVVPPGPNHGAEAVVQFGAPAWVVIGAGTERPVTVLVAAAEDLARIEASVLNWDEGKPPPALIVVEIRVETNAGPGVFISTGATAKSLTPETCRPAPLAERDALVAALVGSGPVAVEPLASGTCSVEITVAGKRALLAREIPALPSRASSSSGPSACPSSSGTSP